ncbi:MAG: hypothetical protein ACREMF_02810, partial [Gemmatimonadales bacterium]
MAQGAQGGIGADVFSGRVMWNVNGRMLWLQRNGGKNVFAIQFGLGVSPRLQRAQPAQGSDTP